MGTIQTFVSQYTCVEVYMTVLVKVTTLVKCSGVLCVPIGEL